MLLTKRGGLSEGTLRRFLSEWHTLTFYEKFEQIVTLYRCRYHFSPYQSY